MPEHAAPPNHERVGAVPKAAITREGVDRLAAELAALQDGERVTLSRRARQARLFVDGKRGETLARVAEHDLAALQLALELVFAHDGTPLASDR